MLAEVLLQSVRHIQIQVDDHLPLALIDPQPIHIRRQAGIGLPDPHRLADVGAEQGEMGQYVPVGRGEMLEQVQTDGRIQLRGLLPEQLQLPEAVGLAGAMQLQVALQHPAHGATVKTLTAGFGHFEQLVVRFAHGRLTVFGFLWRPVAPVVS